ncbi:ABC transporter [Microbacterium sp. HM58-2]|nr:ABC transporter [Microbacterium sp. HM58-2]
MASKSTTKDIETVEAAEAADLLQVVNDSIMQVIETHGINVQKNRYKAMRAIAWQAFVESIEAGDFEALVQRASANVDALPSGWEIKVPAKAAPKPAPTKRTAKAARA